MSIYLRTGAPGHGKTYGALRLIMEALERGQWVATNIELHDGWAVTMAKCNQVRRLIPGRVAHAAAEFERRIYVTRSLEEFARLRLPPCKTCSACKKGRRCRKEGRGAMVLDEAHNWLNARTWDADETGEAVTRAAAVKKRQGVNRLFSQHRKLGWDLYLIAQDEGDIDKQVRNKFEYHTHLKNMHRFRPMGFPIVPFNLFVEVTHWHDNDKSRQGVRTYLLNRRLANCYDTMATSHGLDWDAPDAIWLGQPDHGRQPAASDEVAAPAPALALAPEPLSPVESSRGLVPAPLRGLSTTDSAVTTPEASSLPSPDRDRALRTSSSSPSSSAVLSTGPARVPDVSVNEQRPRGSVAGVAGDQNVKGSDGRSEQG